MDKVKITREQADALEKTRLIYSDCAIVDLKMSSTKEYGSIKNIDTDTLIRALYIGYEVEETPEGKVRKYFNELKENDLYSANDRNVHRAIVKNTLNRLNIKIVGVNHE